MYLMFTHLSSLSARMPMTLQVCVTTPERPRSAASPITLLAFLSDSRGTRSRSNSSLKMRKSDSRLQNYVQGEWVTHQVVANLLLISKYKFRFGPAFLAWPKRNFCFDVNGRFVTT